MLKQKQINLTSETAITIEYIKAGRLSDIFHTLKDKVLFIKRELSCDDVSWLESHHTDCSVFTTHPKTITVNDLISSLEKVMAVQILKSIDLNYIHSGDVLYVFSDITDIDHTDDVPNIIKLYPIYRKDIETQLIFLKDVIKEDLNSIDKNQDENKSQANTVPSNESNICDDEKKMSDKEQTPSENDLLRAEVKRLFDEKYVVVKTEFKGTSIERKTVSLSKFYSRYNIAKGNLKGSWSLFNKESMNQIIDEGIARKAIDDVYHRYTVSIDYYGRIVRIQDKDAFIKDIENVKSDYISYLRCDNECKKIGNIPIKVEFSPEDSLKANKIELIEYLRSLYPANEINEECYNNDAEHFVKEMYKKYQDFSSGVKLNTVYSSYTDEQWKNSDFLYKVMSAIKTSNKSHKNYFEEDFIRLLDRYMESMPH